MWFFGVDKHNDEHYDDSSDDDATAMVINDDNKLIMMMIEKKKRESKSWKKGGLEGRGGRLMMDYGESNIANSHNKTQPSEENEQHIRKKCKEGEASVFNLQHAHRTTISAQCNALFNFLSRRHSVN